MVNINDEFPSKYLKSGDLQGAAVKVKISNVTSEDIGGDRKLIMHFENRTKGMVLNKTNARTIADVYGDDTDNWIGGLIEVFAMKVDFQGRMVDGLRVRVPRQAPARAQAAPNARDRAEQPAMAEAHAAGGQPFDDGFDDDSEIPF
jgi:hypothetical protein